MDNQENHRLELGFEFLAELLIFIYPYGADQMGLQHNFWLGLACWIVGTVIAVRIFWIFPLWENRLSRVTKGLISGIVVATLVLVFFKPITIAYGKRNLENHENAPLDKAPRADKSANTENSSAQNDNKIGPVKQGDCGVIQNGGTGNSAAPCSNITNTYNLTNEPKYSGWLIQDLFPRHK